MLIVYWSLEDQSIPLSCFADSMFPFISWICLSLYLSPWLHLLLRIKVELGMWITPKRKVLIPLGWNMLTGSARVGVGREREKARDTEGRAGGDKSMPMCKRAHRHTYTRWLTFTFLLTQAESRPCNLYESLILPQELKCICLPPFLFFGKCF